MRPIALLVLFAALAACSIPAQEPPGSARQLFLEGWFQETAERNLERALELYLRCRTLALQADPELAARAVFRAAQILRARGETERAAAEFRRLAADLPETEWGRRAREELEGRGRVESVAASAAERALAHLETLRMLQGSRLTEFNLAAMLKDIFEALSADQILARVEDEPLGFVVALERAEDLLDPVRFRPILTELVLRGGQGVAEKAMKILTYREDSSLFEASRILENLALLGEGPASVLLHHLLNLAREEGTRDQAVALLLRLFEENPFYRDATRSGSKERNVSLSWSILGTLLDIPSPEAAKILRLLRETDLEEYPRLGSLGSKLQHVHPGSWTADTPAAALVRKLIPAMEPGTRRALAQSLGKQMRLAPDQIARGAALFFEDPEPAIREELARTLLRSGPRELDPLLREWFGKADPPARASLLPEMQQRFPIEELLGRLGGDLKEYAYWLYMRSRSLESRLLDVVELGAKAGDREFLRAAFQPRFHSTQPFSELVSTAWKTSFPEGALLSAPGQRSFLEAIRASKREDLLVRVIRAAADHFFPEAEGVLVPLMRLAKDLADPSGLEEVALMAGSARTPRVREALVEALPVALFPPELVIALLNDPNRLVAWAMMEKTSQEELLIAAVRQAPAIRFPDNFLTKAWHLESRALARVLLERLPAGHVLRPEAIKQLCFLGDLRPVVSGLSEPDLAPTCQKLLMGLIEGLAPEEQGLFSGFDRESSQEWGEAHFGALERAWKRQRIARLLDSKEGPPEKIGRELARLGAMDELIARESRSDWLDSVTAWCLQALGKKELLLEHFRTLFDPAPVLPALFAAGLDAAVKAELLAGRLPLTEEVVDAIGACGRDRLLVELAFLGVPVRPSTQGRSPGLTSRVREALARSASSEELARAITLFDDPNILQLLIGREEYALILSELPSWPGSIQAHAARFFQRRTGIPFGLDPWPTFEEQRARLLEAWREALAR